MPNRMLRDWTDSEKVNRLSVHSERFFTRLIMKVDDYGCFHADTRLLKAHLFPLLLDAVREADLLRWTTECQKAGLVVLYESAGKRYLQVLDFKQRLDKAKSKFPLPTFVHEFPETVNDFPAELEVEPEYEKKVTPSGVSEADASRPDNLLYSDVEKSKKGIYDFIKHQKPLGIDPYKDFWNLFAVEKGLSPIKKISDTRKRKFNVRIREQAFNFPEILRKAGQSEFLRTGKWFGFDWIIENDSNYLKVLEGNYDGGAPAAAVESNVGPSPTEAKAHRILNEVNN